VISVLSVLSDLDLLDENFCNGSPHWPFEEFELRADSGLDSELGLDLDLHPPADMVVQQLSVPAELEAITPDTFNDATVTASSSESNPYTGIRRDLQATLALSHIFCNSPSHRRSTKRVYHPDHPG
jgi:hypothetical protein